MVKKEDSTSFDSVKVFTNENIKTNSEYKFHSLAPVRNVELGVYKDALDTVFIDDNLLNIAITGAYGAGKSSVVYTYEKELSKEEKSKKKFIYISLSYFIKNGEKPAISSLEGKILNQLIHQIDVDEAPLSHVKNKKEMSSKLASIISGLSIALLVCFLYLLYYQQLLEIVNALGFLYFLSHPFIQIIAILAILTTTFFILKKFIERRMYKNFLQKIKILEMEINVCQGAEHSCFDKHLDEIIY